MADIAHPSGLVASGIHPSPWPFCHFVTSTTHKTLRGPRGGIILMGSDFENTWNIVAPKTRRVKKVSELIDSSVMPGIQGGPLMHVIAGKAVAFSEAKSPEFKAYSQNTVKNAKVLSETLLSLGYDILSGGTDTHIVLIDLSSKNISGKDAEKNLELAGIATNKNMVPFDIRSPMITSGLRIGTPALTTRGMGEDEMVEIAKMIDEVLGDINNQNKIAYIRERVETLCSEFSIYHKLELNEVP